MKLWLSSSLFSLSDLLLPQIVVPPAAPCGFPGEGVVRL
jgi:hypothetical protein